MSYVKEFTAAPPGWRVVWVEFKRGKFRHRSDVMPGWGVVSGEVVPMLRVYLDGGLVPGRLRGNARVVAPGEELSDATWRSMCAAEFQDYERKREAVIEGRRAARDWVIRRLGGDPDGAPGVYGSTLMNEAGVHIPHLDHALRELVKRGVVEHRMRHLDGWEQRGIDWYCLSRFAEWALADGVGNDDLYRWVEQAIATHARNYSARKCNAAEASGNCICRDG